MRDSKIPYIVNGVAAFLFACTGPVAIIFSVAATLNLSDQHVASWLFAGFSLAGLHTLYYSIRYRQPLSFGWSIPGSVLLLSALDHLSFNEVVGAYLATAALIAVVGLSGWVQRILQALPRAIVMAMVAGIFFDFGLGVITAFEDSALIAASMVLAFIGFSLHPRGQRYMPPVLAALLAGALVVAVSGALKPSALPLSNWVTTPQLFTPQFSLQAMLELVVPLGITVLVVQNGQGFAVLSHAGHKPPVNSMTTACGVGSVLFGLLGSVSMCVTGPSNAILSSTGRREYQYIGGITYALLGIAFGLFAAAMTWLVLKLPAAYIAVLGGLAVLRVLQSAFVAAFSSQQSLGALVTLLITVSDLSLFNIGAPFWGLVVGMGLSALLERRTPSPPKQSS